MNFGCQNGTPLVFTPNFLVGFPWREKIVLNMFFRRQKNELFVPLQKRVFPMIAHVPLLPSQRKFCDGREAAKGN